MQKPILVVMAAGMGSRYGGLKQIDPVGKNGEIIMDFSVFDALRAGFSKVVFIIKEELYADFRAVVGDRVAKYMPVEYAFQKLTDLPEGFAVPEGRVKPWGTGHAVLAARAHIDAPFAVINADDFYGDEAFAKIGEFLQNAESADGKAHWAMVGYHLCNTLTENGHVARGVCETDENGDLTGIHERTRIEKRADGPAYTEDDGATWTALPQESIVSMNMWGFTESILQELKARFSVFLDENLEKNPLKCEYFLPFVVDELLSEGKADVRVLKSLDRWYGVTYKEDKEVVVKAIQGLKDKGLYPQKLWEE